MLRDGYYSTRLNIVRELCPAGTLREHDRGSAREDGLRKSESERWNTNEDPFGLSTVSWRDTVRRFTFIHFCVFFV